jgi:hypothetical protein
VENDMKTEISAMKNDMKTNKYRKEWLRKQHQCCERWCKCHGNEDKGQPRRSDTGNQCLSEENNSRSGWILRKGDAYLRHTVEERDDTSRAAGTRTPGRLQQGDTSHSAVLRDPAGCDGRPKEAHRQRKRRD